MPPKQTDKGTRRVADLLAAKYKVNHPKCDVVVYRYNPVSIRIRIVDPDFRGKSIVERENDVWPILDTLPGDVRDDISVCLLIAPGEQKNSIMNLEFEEPLPSGF
jgi:hypothetical protein